MLFNIFKILISVRAKLFFGFFAMTALIIALGTVSYTANMRSAEVVETTFDRPLMAINYARSASQVFAEIQIEAHSDAAGNFSNVLENSAAIDELISDFRGDLRVAEDRSISDRATPFFAQVEAEFNAWHGILKTPQALRTTEQTEQAEVLADDIQKHLDYIVEFQTNQSFLDREAAVSQVGKLQRYTLFAAIGAVLLTLLMSVWLGWTIVRPLKAAAQAAHRISAGRLDTNIPDGGNDETGALLRTMSLMRDKIKARMESETAMRRIAQTRLAESLDNSNDGILITDNVGYVIIANRKVKALFPFLHRDSLIGHHYMEFFHESGAPKTNVIEGDRPGVFGLPDNRWIDVSTAPTSEAGKLFIWRDVTETRQNQKDLERALSQARAADQAKTRFLAAMSHELRTPLNAVIGFSDMIASEKFGPLENPQYHQMAELISQSGAQLLRIVKDVLDFANNSEVSIQGGSIEPVNLTDVLTHSIKQMQRIARDKQVTITFDAAIQDIWVRADRIRLDRIFANVLSNAVKFNRAGGQVNVRLRQSADLSFNHVEIIDTGMGMSPETLQFAHQPFYQQDDTTTRVHDGVGLGLSIVEQLVTSHGGYMKIDSTPDVGTTVRISLPGLTNSQTQPMNIAS